MEHLPSLHPRLAKLLWTTLVAWTLLGAQHVTAQVCEGPFTATNDQHVDAGRVRQSSTADCSACFFGICGFPAGCDTPSTAYLAVGSGQQVGTSGSAATTLYESPAGFYSTTPCDSTPNEGMQYVSLVGTAFRHDGRNRHVPGGAAIPRDASWYAAANVPLPNGARVQELKCAFYNNAGLELMDGSQIKLISQDMTGGTNVTHATIDLAGQSSGHTLKRSDASLSMDADTLVSLEVQLRFQTAPADDRFSWVGCKVGYLP